MQTTATRQALCILALLLLGLGNLSRAAEIDAEDVRAVREVSEAQLDAFAVDDAALAFSFASPSIRKRFGDQSQFKAMVRSAYPMPIQPTAIAFLRRRYAGTLRRGRIAHVSTGAASESMPARPAAEAKAETARPGSRKCRIAAESRYAHDFMEEGGRC